MIGQSDSGNGINKVAPSDDVVEISVEKLSALAAVNSHRSELLDKEQSDDSKLTSELKKAETNDEPVLATVKLDAKLDLSGSSADSVSSALKTTGFLFEQMVNDLQTLSKRGALQETKKKIDTNELCEDFHAHMMSVLHNLRDGDDGISLLEHDLGSVEDIMAIGPEEYIASIRKLIKSDGNNSLTVWYRGLRYEAYVPLGHGAEEEKFHKTVATTCYDISCGLVVNCFQRIKDRLFPAATTADYQRLGVAEYEMVGPGMRRKPVLKDLSGVLRHGKLTLVLGPPGSSKTSYLRAISGQLHRQQGVSAAVSGEVRYNHFLVEKLKKLANWSTYCGQLDEHQALLTVRETFEFAWKCRKEARLDERVTKVMKERIGVAATERIQALTRIEVDFVLAVLGLTNCAETIIGNATLKGISGGEKRRVTLGEMLLTGAQVLALDEVSTGLDSAATYDIVRFLGASAHFLDEVVVVALLQPPPEVIDLFDDIVLLAEGNVIFHGPREDIKGYFERLGYRCPERKDLGDFLQELPTSTGETFLLPEEERRRLNLPARPPRTADEFGQAWKQSPEGLRMDEEVAQEAQRQFELEEEMLQRDLTRSNRYANLSWDDMPENSAWKELMIVLRWSWTLKMRKRAEIFARVFQNIFMGTIFGLLFWQIGFDEWYLKAMLFAQMPGFMQGGAIGNVPKLVMERGVFYKQNSAKFYKAFSFAIAQFIVQLPFTAFDALVFGNLLYYMCGLVNELDRHLMFLFLAILFGVLISQMMRVFAYSVRNESAALTLAVMFYLLFLIFSGQLATPDVIPSYMKWFFWLNPLAWVYRAMAINEFKADYYGASDSQQCNMTMHVGGKEQVINVPERCGDFFLKNRQFETDEAYITWAIWVMIGYIIFFLSLTILILTYVRFDREYTETEEEEPSEAEGGEDREERIGIATYGRTESLAVPSKTLVFTDLWYSVSIPGATSKTYSSVDLLKGVYGWALPGRMTALMGSSGAGKTTLLDVLADRKTTGTTRGHILVNSAPPNRKLFKKMVGYVEQFGVHALCSTVHESLLFSASLRLAPHSQHKVHEFVQETMELLELDVIQDELAMNLSVEENKRLTIATELVANPSILFADEPTSGLDARAAAIVMRCILNVARSGRTVICTIHQPSIAVFTLFDDLLLMRRGGEVVYFGEIGQDSKKLISYFEAIPGTKKCPVGFNPATWMLDVIGAGTAEATVDSVDFAAVYRKSKLCQENMERLKLEFLAPMTAEDALPLIASPGGSFMNTNGQSELLSPLRRPSSLSDGSAEGTTSLENMTSGMKRSYFRQRKKSFYRKQLSEIQHPPVDTTQPFRRQVWLLLKRAQNTYWRSPEFSLSRLLVILLVAFIITATFWQQEYHEAADIQSRIQAISFLVMVSGIYNLFTIMPFTIDKRALFYRETSSGMYSALALVVADALVELPYLVVQTLVGVNIVYFGVGFQEEIGAYSFYTFLFFLYVLLMTSIGLFFASLMPDAMSAQLTATVLIQIFQLFAGVIVPYTKLPTYFKFLYYFSAQHWITEGIITAQFHGDDTIICDPHGKVITDAPREVWNNKFCSETGHFSWSDLLNKKFTGAAKTAQDFVYGQEGSFLQGYEYDNHLIDVVAVVSWIIALRFATTLVVLFVDHNKR